MANTNESEKRCFVSAMKRTEADYSVLEKVCAVKLLLLSSRREGIAAIKLLQARMPPRRHKMGARKRIAESHKIRCYQYMEWKRRQKQENSHKRPPVLLH